MNSHIVRVNEKIEKIALLYNLTVNEIMDCNHHIQDWGHLVPGTKLRLPEIPEIVRTELDNTEPFIEEYYPKIDVQTILEKNQKEQPNEASNLNINVVDKSSNEPTNESIDIQTMEKSSNSKIVTKQKNHYMYPYPPYYGYYYPYYSNNGYYTNHYVRNKKRKSKSDNQKF